MEKSRSELVTKAIWITLRNLVYSGVLGFFGGLILYFITYSFAGESDMVLYLEMLVAFLLSLTYFTWESRAVYSRIVTIPKMQKFEREQVAKGLAKFADIQGEVRWGTPAEVLRWKQRQDRLVSLMDSQFDELTSSEFWDLVGHLFIEMGYKVPESWFKESLEVGEGKGSVLKKGDQEILVRISKLRVGYVLTDISILSFLDGMQRADVKRGLFVTNTGFSDEAIQQAEGRPVELWNHEILCELVYEHFDSLAPKIGSLVEARLRLQQDLETLEPKEFERWVGGLMRKLGYEVEDLPFVGDYGADLIARKRGEVAVVQCKKYSPSHRVGARDVQRVLGSMSYYKANRAILATTSGFTKQAKKQAKGASIKLWDRKALLEILQRTERGAHPPKSLESKALVPMPRCSVCGREFPESQLRRCYDCGKAYCPECAEKDPTIKELGVCPDCEEVFEAEEDYWGWE